MSHETTPSHSRKAPSLWPFFALGLLMLLLFWGVNKWLIGSDPSNPEPEEAARAVLRAKNLADLRAENALKLEQYAWIDRAKGTVQVPVAVAMELVLPELNASAPRPAYPIVVPAAPPAAAMPSPAP